MGELLVIFAVTAIVGTMIGIRIFKANKEIDHDIRSYLLTMQWDEDDKK